MKFDYPFDKVFWQEFEDVVIKVCQDILGIGAKKFATGKDGGRDSRFTGKAERFPSSSEPWSGKWIIQAKHTEDSSASCSDSEFSGDGKNSIVSKEIERLKKLKQKDPFNNYLLFTNRKLPANQDHKTTERIKSEVGLTNVELIGKEQLSTYITQEIAHEFDLIKYVLPFRFFEKDIQEVVLLFHDQQLNIQIDTSTVRKKFDHITKEEKNRLNGLSERYFTWLKSESLAHFMKIETFLKDPRNNIYANYYQNTISDLQGKIMTKRNEFAQFDEVIEYIVDLILNSDIERLKNYRRLIRVFVHFMYWQCDIGEKE
ncbi:MAG: hypothetical protein JJ978_00290 [Roseivirga sp.]|uniref:ABC-three component system protein n=1 Tax=Roseivirga sp. TaxID=1964215 RepID=UPI001B2181D9|nr:ABC-three component system protein [Roseivirga sp.]MBO6493977.1 hypothetical protein [Roseivirga sp.]